MNKKPRVIFMPRELFILEEYYSKNRFPKASEREHLSRQLNISSLNIQVRSRCVPFTLVLLQY